MSSAHPPSLNRPILVRQINELLIYFDDVWLDGLIQALERRLCGYQPLGLRSLRPSGLSWPLHLN